MSFPSHLRNGGQPSAGSGEAATPWAKATPQRLTTPLREDGTGARETALTAAIQRIGTSLDLDTGLREVVESARALIGAARDRHCDRERTDDDLNDTWGERSRSSAGDTAGPRGPRATHCTLRAPAAITLPSARPSPPGLPSGHPAQEHLREKLQSLDTDSVSVSFESRNREYRLPSYRPDPASHVLDDDATNQPRTQVMPQIHQSLPRRPHRDGQRGILPWDLAPDSFEIHYLRHVSAHLYASPNSSRNLGASHEGAYPRSPRPRRTADLMNSALTGLSA